MGSLQPPPPAKAAANKMRTNKLNTAPAQAQVRTFVSQSMVSFLCVQVDAGGTTYFYSHHQVRVQSSTAGVVSLCIASHCSLHTLHMSKIPLTLPAVEGRVPVSLPSSVPRVSKKYVHVVNKQHLGHQIRVSTLRTSPLLFLSLS